MNNKVQTAIKVSANTRAMVVLGGCAASNSRLDALETQHGLMEQEVAAAKSSAASAQQAAESAQAAADAALKAANESQACCDATNEKVDRMFQRSQSK